MYISARIYGVQLEKELIALNLGRLCLLRAEAFPEMSESGVQTSELWLASIPGFLHFLLVHFIAFPYLLPISVLLPKVKEKSE